jgi:large subunit ribosomal protein L36
MKVQNSVKLLCKDCYFVKKRNRLFVRCKSFPRHKRRQGFSTLVQQPLDFSKTECHQCGVEVEN